MQAVDTGKPLLSSSTTKGDVYVRTFPGFPKGSFGLRCGASGANGARKPVEGSGGRGEARGQSNFNVNSIIVHLREGEGGGGVVLGGGVYHAGWSLPCI